LLRSSRSSRKNCAAARRKKRRYRAQEESRRDIERGEREEEARLEAQRREAEDLSGASAWSASGPEERERAPRGERARIKEQEERRVKAELERNRQAGAKSIPSARREEELSRRRKEQEGRDRKRAEVESLKRHKSIRTPLERLRPLVIGVVVIVALVVGGIQVIPINAYIPSIEKLAFDHIGEPVTIGSVRISVLGGFSVNLDNVRVGTTQDVKIRKVEVSLDLGRCSARSR
jgi:hypothetical protein